MDMRVAGQLSSGAQEHHNVGPIMASRRGRLLALLLVSLLFAGGCGGGPTTMAVSTSFHEFTQEEILKRDAVNLERYRLKPGDEISVDFKYQDELDRAGLLILPDGHFSLAGAEDVKAAGLTVAELDKALTSRFALEYRNPDLSVIVGAIGRQEIYVFGEVESPGAYPLPYANFGVLQVVSLAGGFSKHASTKELLLIRAKETGYEYRIADISHLEKRAPMGLASLDVQANDILFVPRNTMGDLQAFSDSFLGATLKVADLFWDVYAIGNIHKVDRIVR